MLERSERDNALGIRKLSATFTPTAGGEDECDMLIQVVDDDGVAVPGLHTFIVWLANGTALAGAAGKGIDGTGAAGSLNAKSTFGQDLGILTAATCLVVQTLENGSYTLEITDSGRVIFYVAVQFFGQIDPVVSAIMVDGDYGGT